MGTKLSDLLSAAKLQMASESFLMREVDAGRIPTPDEIRNRVVEGNTHASRFVELRAEEFVVNYELLAQYRNDPKKTGGTGFSGSLFRDRITGELTLSFRSTEFIDDNVRDSKSTNALEVKEFGWA